MCAVSAVHDTMQRMPPNWWDRDKVNDYEDIVKRLDEFDKKYQLEECDPNKAEFLKHIKQRIEQLEQEKNKLLDLAKDYQR